MSMNTDRMHFLVDVFVFTHTYKLQFIFI